MIVTKAKYAHYMKNRNIIEGMKEQNDGLIGVYKEIRQKKGKDIAVYTSRLPLALGKKTKAFDHPLKACMHYNMTVRRCFGSDAVLCDPLAVVRRFMLDGNEVS